MYPQPQRVRNRNIGTISNQLANNKPSAEPLSSSHFLNCRYDPFGKTPVKTYIPDGKGRNVIVRDIKFAHNIVVADKEQLNIEIAPFLPFPVSFAPDGFMNGTLDSQSTVDGFKIGGCTTGGPSATESLFLRAVFPNLLKPDIVWAFVGEGNSVLGARITTIGYRLFYTGTASSAQGLLIATDHNWSMDALSTNNILAAPQGIAVSPAAAYTFDAVAAGIIPEFCCAVTTMTTTNAVTSQTVLRPENGLRGVLKYQLPADAHTFRPWIENGAIVTRPSSAGGGADVNTMVRCSTAWPTSGILRQYLVDPALMCSMLKITAPGSYRLEVAVCYEQDISPNNYYIDMARQSPMIDRVLLDVDSALNSTVHPAALSDPLVDVNASMKAMTLEGRLATAPARRTRRSRRRRRNRRRNRGAKPCPGKSGKK